MSGTSLDGVDIAIIELSKTDNNWKWKIKEAETIPYPRDWIDRLTYNPSLKAEQLLQLDAGLGIYFGKLITGFIQQKNIAKSKIDFIASHGHTLYHAPGKGYTSQIGHGAHIQAQTGITVICDFRYQDIALGGQGAPLVPIGDELLFSDYDACINLGGFANISFSYKGTRTAYDICPVNFVLNKLAGKLGKPFDENGQLASQGNIDEQLLKTLNQLPYYQKEGNKTLSAEWVEKFIEPLLYTAQQNTKSLLRTFTEHIALQLANSLSKHQLQKVLITGGGAYNDFLLNRIKNISKSKITIPKNELIEFKEALVFALLGVLRIRDEVNILASSTGSSKNHSSGIIYR